MLQVFFSVLSSLRSSLYLCGIITAPHAGLACILHRFESVSWFCVYADISDKKKKRLVRESSGFVWMWPQFSE